MNRHYHIIFLVLFMAMSCINSAEAARAKTKAKKVDPMEKYNEAVAAFDNYNFNEAVKLLDEYKTAVAKSNGKTSYPDITELRRRSETGASMLERVEQVVILDSMVVSKKDFFDAYKLSPAAGTLIKDESVASSFGVAANTPVYVTEKGNTMIYSAISAEDSLLYILTSTRLVDGSWEKPYDISHAMITDANAAYPFLMPDGVTLYFASDNDDSLGGYDIFMSRREGKDYLKPQNMGMPYNSPADDYMLAIDEMTGAGWWATDRNNIPDSVTIYMFAPAELRINYPANTPGLTDKARITDIASTRTDGKDYKALTDRIKAIVPLPKSNKSEFHFAMPDGSLCTSLNQLRNPDAVAAMRRYLSVAQETAQIETDLRQLRNRYSNGDKSVSSEIITLENELLKHRRLMREISNNVIKAEYPNL